MRNLIKLIVLFGIVGILLIPIIAQADATLTFYNITNNNPGDAGIGEDQARVDVIDLGGPQVDFKFYLVTGSDGVLDAMSITDVYYDDGGLFGISTITNSAGVSFNQPASPNVLPGGNNVIPPFVVSADFSADSDPPAYHNGVNNLGEFVTITFDLLTGITYNDIIDDLSTGDLRIGIHVQGFDTGGSEGFVNNPPNGGPGTPVPEPGSLCLALGALFLIFGIGAKRKKEV